MPNMSSLTKFLPFLLMLVGLILAFNVLGPIGGVVVLIICIAWLIWRRRASLHYSAARNCFDTGDMETARVHIKKAVAAESDNSILRASCGFMYLKMGAPVDAERMLNVALSTAKTPREKYNAQTIMSLLLWKKGKLDEAIAMLESVMENYKTSTTYATMGFFMIARGNVKKALDFNREAYEFNGKNPVILDNYGSALIMDGAYEEALKIYGELMPLKPTFPDAYFNLARLFEALGRNQEALDMYQTAASRKFWYTSTITREEVDEHLEALEEKMGLPVGGLPEAAGESGTGASEFGESGTDVTGAGESGADAPAAEEPETGEPEATGEPNTEEETD
jgi:Tfp pilus assembly protein PilF